jgi:C4-dicarboxylate transporter DctM subunit
VCALFALMMLGIPIVFSIGFVALIGAIVLYGPASLFVFGASPFNVWFDMGWLPLPLFVLLGCIIAETTMGEDIFTVGRKWLARVPGGLVVSGIFGEAVMAAALGTSTACILVIGQVADREFQRQGYDRGFGLGALLAGGVLGPLIPPSATMVIYSGLADVSLGKLFMAGIVPGVLLALVLMALTVFLVWRKPELAPLMEKVSLREKLASLPRILPVVCVILAALGSIYLGIATPTEAAGLACVVTLLIGIALFRLRLKGILAACKQAALISGMIMFLLVSSTLFNYVVGSSNVAATLFDLINAASLPSWAVIAILNIIIILLGFVIDPMSITMLGLPIMLPIVTSLGYDPVWFGIVFLINTQIGLITPPMAADLLTVRTFFGVGTKELVRGVLPYFLVLLVFLVVVAAVPQLSLWLPGVMVGK